MLLSDQTFCVGLNRPIWRFDHWVCGFFLALQTVVLFYRAKGVQALLPNTQQNFVFIDMRI